MLKQEIIDNKTTEEKESTDSAIDDLLADVAETDSTNVLATNPIMDRIVGYGYQGGPVMAQFATRDQEQITAYLNRSDVRRLLPADFRYIKFAWGKPLATGDVVELYALKSNRDDMPPLSGGVVVDATQSYDALGESCSIHANERIRCTHLGEYDW